MHVLRHSAAMRLLRAGIDTSVIALWLGHEQIETTQIYLHADMEIKERALDKTAPIETKPGRFRPTDKLLAFLEALCLCRLHRSDPRPTDRVTNTGRHNPNVGIMRLPAGRFPEFLESGAVGAPEQVENLGGLAARSDTVSLQLRGLLGRRRFLGRRGLGLAAFSLFRAFGRTVLWAGSLLRGGLLRRDVRALCRNSGGFGVGCGFYIRHRGALPFGG